MEQVNFTDVQQAGLPKTRNQILLETMEANLPFAQFVKIVEPFYFKNELGRNPIGIEIMLRVTFAQKFLGLSDRQIEDAIIENFTVRKFCKVDVINGSVPDFTTVCKFRKILTDNNLQKQFFNSVAKILSERGLLLREGKVVDATIIHTSKSKKNSQKKRIGEGKWTKKAGNYHHGDKSHVAVDVVTGMVAAHITTPANVHDSNMANKLIGKNCPEVHGDSGFLGIEKRKDANKHTKYSINHRPSQIQKFTPEEQENEHQKSRKRAKVEFIFNYLKNFFRHKVRYKTLHKNDADLDLYYLGINIWKMAKA